MRCWKEMNQLETVVRCSEVKNPLVSVVIIVRNMQDTIGACIKSIVEQNIPESKYEIIVIDNNSTDKTREVVRQYPVKLFFEEKVGNFGGARNRGVKVSSGDIIAFIDADCIAEKDFLERVLTLHSSFPNVAGFGGATVNPYLRSKVARTIAYAQNGDWCASAPKRIVNYLPGCNSTYKKKTLVQAGMFPEGTPSEDILLGDKVRAMRQIMFFDPTLKVKHNFDTTLARLAYKEERCGRGHFNMFSSSKRVSKARLMGIMLFSPFFLLGRCARGFHRIILYSVTKKDAVVLLPYLFYSGFYWTKGYLERAIEVRRKQRTYD